MPDASLLARRHLLAAIPGMACMALLPRTTLAKPVPGAPALLLATDATPDVDPAGYLVSEKYDGVRAVWDGHHLRFRSGLPISAPAWFTARLPTQPLDGELWLGRGRFEALSGAVRRASPDAAAWRALRYMVFELPGGSGSFARRALALAALCETQGWPQLVAAPQVRVDRRAALQRRLDDVVRGGGEGLVLHRADADYTTGRSSVLMKLKPLQDAEAEVLSHVPGRGRHAGRLGALRVQLEDGTQFLIGTGFSDAQRDNPPPVGAVVTFSYRGHTDAGVPRFASFLRLRSV